MTFESDDDFAEYLTEITADVDSYVQENSNEGLKNSPSRKVVRVKETKLSTPRFRSESANVRPKPQPPAIAGLPTNQ